MKNLFDASAYTDIRNRIMRLQVDSRNQWGKMDVAQMMAHSSAALEVAAGLTFPHRRFLGRIIGPIFKPVFLGETPFRRNSPTDPSFVVADRRDFNRERERLLDLVRRFSEGGAARCTTHPHSFFGQLTPQEWAVAMYKHLDHHLRQFGA